MDRDEMVERGARALPSDDESGVLTVASWEDAKRVAAAVVDAITPDDEWEQVGWLHDTGRMFVSGIKALPEEQRPEGWEPVYVKRTPPVAPEPEGT